MPYPANTDPLKGQTEPQDAHQVASKPAGAPASPPDDFNLMLEREIAELFGTPPAPPVRRRRAR
jgi:hypothetical protein